MTDPNQYMRRDDVEKIIDDMIRRQQVIQTSVRDMLADAQISPANRVMSERADLASRVREGELLAARALLGLAPGFTYRRFCEYDGATEYFAMVANDADRVPLAPVKADEVTAEAA